MFKLLFVVFCLHNGSLAFQSQGSPFIKSACQNCQKLPAFFFLPVFYSPAQDVNESVVSCRLQYGTFRNESCATVLTVFVSVLYINVTLRPPVLPTDQDSVLPRQGGGDVAEMTRGRR